MIVSIGYEMDGDYLKSVLEMFGKYDVDGSGGIEFSEFASLWVHLGGDDSTEWEGWDGDGDGDGDEDDDEDEEYDEDDSVG